MYINKFVKTAFGLGILLFSLATFNAQAADSTTEPAKPAAQAAPKEQAQFSSTGWNVACQNNATTDKLICELSQTISNTQTSQLLLRIGISASPNNMLLQMPHGLNLGVGAQIQIDDIPAAQVPYFTSNQNGVFINMALAEDFIVALKKGNILKISMTSSNDVNFSVPLSLKGFTAAFDKLD